MIFLGLLLVFLFGYSLSRPFGNKFSALEDVGLAYILGIGSFSWLMYSLSFFGLKITLWNYLLVLSLLAALFFLIYRSRFNLLIKLEKLLKDRKFERREKILTGLILGLLAIAFIHAIYWPVNVWDSLVIYDFRAKVISEKGFFIQIARDFEYFAHYPPLTSLAHVWVYLLGGSNPRIIYFLFFLAFIGVFYAKLRKRLGRFSSLFLLLLLVSIPALLHHSTFSYTNLPYTIYLSLGFIYLHDFLVDQNTDSLNTSALLLGLSTFTRRFEPFWLVWVLILVSYLMFRKERFKDIVVSLFIFFLIYLSWKVFEMSLGISSYGNSDYVSFAKFNFEEIFSLKKVQDILVFIYTNILSYWGLVLFMFVLNIAWDIRKGVNETKRWFLFIVLGNMALFLVGIYIFSLTYPTWQQIPDSAQRLSMFFFPLFIYYSSLSDLVSSSTKSFMTSLPTLVKPKRLRP